MIHWLTKLSTFWCQIDASKTRRPWQPRLNCFVAPPSFDPLGFEVGSGNQAVILRLQLLSLALAVCVSFTGTSVAQQVERDYAIDSEKASTSDAELQLQIADLIAQLGDSNFHRRLNARWRLERIGLLAFEQLREAALFSKNVEVADAAAYIIESQNIAWWLETDSVEVRSYLAGYSAASKSKREESILLLGKLDTLDAQFALCRLARYERFEDVSKLAALTLLEKLADTSANNSESMPSAAVPGSDLGSNESGSNESGSNESGSKDFIESIATAVGDGDRTSIQWIRLFTDNVIQANAKPQPWSELARREIEDFGDQPLPQKTMSLRFCRWIVTWLSKTTGKEAVINSMADNLVSATTGDPFQLRGLATWALDEELPDILIAVAEKHPRPFESSGELGYLLAASYLMMGEAARAEELAAQASQNMGPDSVEARELAERNGLRGTAVQRYRMANYLEQRGLFNWAEREYRKAIEEKSDRYDSDIRVACAQFYWFAGRNSEAAEVLRPVAEAIELTDGSNIRSVAQFDRTSKLATYYFFDGLGHIDDGNLLLAQESLRKSYELDSSNPDVVIAMKQAATTDEFKGHYRACFDEMKGLFRSIVVDLEKQLVFANDREDRRRSEQSLATACNQLAWLLGKCEEDLDEAIRLGQRAIELRPDTSAYLDTLGRCYFSAGDFDNAVKYQREAVRLSPHERQMAAQLAEFQSAAQSAAVQPAADRP